MNKYERYSHLVALEAQRHLHLASVSTEPQMAASHCEVAVALMHSVILLRLEVVKTWKSYPASERKKTFIPEAFHCGLTVECDRQVTGTVIWVHPRGRFYVVRVEIQGHVWHECFMPGE